MSSAPCPSEAPEYYLTILHVIAGFSAPVNLYAMYLVLFRSPNIGKYKYGICHLQLASFFTELQMSIVCPGYYFFPLLGGYNTGKFFGQFFRSHIYMTMYTFFLASELPAIVWCFIYRHNSAVDMRNRQKPRRPLKTLLTYICQAFPFATCICMYLSDITPAQAHGYLEKNFPQCLFWESSQYFVVYDFYANFMVAVTGIGAVVMVCLAAITMTVLGAHTMYLLHQLRPHMSPTTYKLHRTALISLSLQVIIPSVLLIVPVYMCFYVVLFELVEYQGMATNMTIMIGCHSVTSSLVMIVTNPRYRRFVLNAMKAFVGIHDNTQRRSGVDPSTNPSHRRSFTAQ